MLLVGRGLTSHLQLISKKFAYLYKCVITIVTAPGNYQVSFDVFFLAASGHCSCMCDHFFTYVDTDSARPCSLSSLDWPLYFGDASTFLVGLPLVMVWSHWEPLSTVEVAIEWEHRGKKYFARDFFRWCTVCVQTHNVCTYCMNTGHVYILYICHVNEKMPAVDILSILKPFNENKRGNGVACLCAQVTSLPLWLDHFHLILPVRWRFGRLSAEAHSSTVPFYKHPQVGGMFNESSPTHTSLWSITCQFCGLLNSSPFVNATTWMIQNTSSIDGRICEPSCDKFAFFLVATNIRVEQGLPCFPNVFALCYAIETLPTSRHLSNEKLAIFRGGFCTVPKNGVVCSGIEAIGCIVCSVSFGLLACRTEKHLDRATSCLHAACHCVSELQHSGLGNRGWIFETAHSAMRIAKSLPHGNGMWNLRKVMHFCVSPRKGCCQLCLLRWQICHCWNLVQQ